MKVSNQRSIYTCTFLYKQSIYICLINLTKSTISFSSFYSGPCDNCDDYCHKPGATRTCVALTDELHIAVFSLSFIRLLINFGNGKYDNGLGNHCCQNTPLEQFYSLVERLNGDLAVGLSVWKLQCGIAELQWNAKQLRRLSKDPKYKDMLAKDFSINEHVDHVVRIHESMNLWLDQNKIDRIQKDNQTRDKQTQKQATEEGKQKKKNQKYDKKVKQRNDKATFTREHEDKVAEQYANQLGAAAAATYESEYISQNGESAANIVAQSLLANAAPSLDSKNRRREKKKKRGTRQLQAIKLLIKEIDYFFWEYDIDPENEPLAEEIAIGYFNLYNDNIEEAIENLEKDFKKKFKEELKVDNPEDFTFLKNVLEKLNCRKRKSQVEVMDRIEEEDEQSDDQEKGLGDESSDESSDEFSDASSNESRDASRNELSDEDEVEEQCTRKCGNCSICIMKLEADTTRERTMETTMGTTMETTTGNTVTEAPPDIGNGTMGMYDALRKDVVLDKNGLQPPLTAAGKRSQQNGEQNRTDRMLGCNKCQWKTEIGCKACRTYGGSLHPFDRKATKYWKQNAKDLILPRQLFNAVSMLGGYKRVFKCNLWDGE